MFAYRKSLSTILNSLQGNNINDLTNLYIILDIVDYFMIVVYI